ncbi:MAG: metal ABC transporter solute-binding protein, Zn/Mn family [Jatrophihabitans sp.]
MTFTIDTGIVGSDITMSRLRRSGTIAALATLGMVVAGCSSDSEADIPKGTVSVVASTSAYGNLAQQVAGGLSETKIRVTSIITDPTQDPHSYEVSTKNRLELSKASIVIENGGGYDDFVRTMLIGAKRKANVIDAVDVSGKKAERGELNEHVWYDLPTMVAVVERIADALQKADPADAAEFIANAKVLSGKLTALQKQEAAVKAAHEGTGVAITEPVALYMLQACGLDNKTPAKFSAAVEEGTDVSPRVLRQTLDLFTGTQVKALVYNAQTVGPETRKVRDAATKNDIVTVPVTENLPPGKDFVQWMTDNLAAIQKALA